MNEPQDNLSASEVKLKRNIFPKTTFGYSAGLIRDYCLSVFPFLKLKTKGDIS